MLESQLEAYFRRQIRTMGGRTHKLIAVEKGMPDRLVLMPGGGLYLIELKTEIGKRSPSQILWHERAAKLGTTVYVLAGKDACRRWLQDRLDDAYNPDRQ